ncbi:MAG: dicarboxylate/amino acid:cation symporter [Neisseriaceae bacterium]|nr:dicarboxylate/amino acid:cation symporter [Neisseriaceae bacterium]
MCSSSKKQNHFKTAVIWFAAMIVGAVLGHISHSFINELCHFIATAFTRLFQFLAIPVISLAVIATLSKLGAKSESKRIFSHTIFYTLTTTLAAALTALAFFLIISPVNVPVAADATVPENIGKLSYYEHFLSVIPNNLLQPFVAGNVLSVLLVSSAVGLGLAFMPDSDNRQTVIKGILGLQELLFMLIRALLVILPVGIVAFTAQLVAEIEAGVIVGALGQYTLVVIGGNLVQFFVIIPLFLLARRLNPLKVFQAMSPALAMAFFSKSSAATLPVTLASAENNLHIDKRVSRFVLPICTTINMNGCAAFILVTSLFLMQNAGVELSLGTMIVWLFVSILAAVGNAGVPMGCYFLTISLMSSINVPVDLMGMILPIYAIIDMIETGVNVWSDSSVAAMTDNDLQGKLDSVA